MLLLIYAVFASLLFDQEVLICGPYMHKVPALVQADQQEKLTLKRVEPSLY